MPPDQDLSTPDGLRALGLYLNDVWLYLDAVTPCVDAMRRASEP